MTLHVGDHTFRMVHMPGHTAYQAAVIVEDEGVVFTNERGGRREPGGRRPETYYSLKDGVWFAAAAPTGPWVVATSVPAVIYTIPVSSPLYYVTYVQVYASTPQVVYVGYTPGYYGTVVAPTSVVVYGTGYVYPPVYVGAYYYPAPVTYGYGAGFAWGAFTGFAFGAATAAIWGGAWGCCHDHYHGDIDINRNVNINRSDAYGRWNQGQVQSNLQSRAQSAQTRATEARQGAQQRADSARQGAQQRADSARQSAQQRADSARQGAQQRADSAQARATEARQGAQQRAAEGRQSVQAAQQQRASTPRSNDVYAGRDGNAYRRGAEGWEQNSGQGWNRADFGGGGESATNLNRQQQARSTGSAREASYQRSGGGGGGGSYSGGGRAAGGGGGARAGGGGGARGGGGGGRRR